MTGLTTQEVQERIKQGKVNEEVSSSTRSVNEIVKSNIFTYFNLIFTVLAVLLIVVGSFKDLSFMLIIFANTGIGIYQEIRSKNTLDNLKFSKMPRSIAIRDGRRQEVDTDRLVLDDVVVLGAGNQIPADARVEDGSVSVNEALITGESDEIEKHPGDELMSGSFVVSGECAARLTAVGKHSYINRLTAEATRQKKNDNQSQMVKSLDRLVMFIGVAIIPIGGILMFQQIAIQGLSFRASVIAMVGAGGCAVRGQNRNHHGERDAGGRTEICHKGIFGRGVAPLYRRSGAESEPRQYHYGGSSELLHRRFGERALPCLRIFLEIQILRREL